MSSSKLSRRELLALGGAVMVSGGLRLRNPESALAETEAELEQSPRKGRPEVIVPNGKKLPWKLVDGVKVFHLIAEEVEHEFTPGLRATCWGYNGSVHGPTIEAVEGDQVRIFVSNRLPAATSVHWHGAILPNGMDGVAGLNQKAIRRGETFLYEFTLKQSGTLMYHAHHDEMTQIALGMTGLFVIHPKEQRGLSVDKDFAIMLHEWRIDPGTHRPNPNEMTEFNILTMNGKVFPATAPLLAKTGERVRVRLGNLGPMDHHPIHLHGHSFTITETNGGRIPDSAQWPETTVLVPVGSTRTIEFTADAPGDWAFHCHMTHHVMNQMGHSLPNMIGVQGKKLDQEVQALLPEYMTMGQDGMADMAEMPMEVPENSIPMLGARGKHDIITMGGMFTVLKVRDEISATSASTWYENPKGSVASLATSEQLRANGISAPKKPS